VNDFPERGKKHPLLWLGFAVATAALHLACLTRYGWFRDEFYYVACARHLAWGYVDHPPLSIGLLALARAAFGESLFAVRLLPVIAAAASVFLTGRLAAELGGGRYAQALACLAATLTPVYLAMGHFYSMNAFDLLLWTAAILVLAQVLREGRPHYWVGLGLVLGLGILNKLSMSWLVMALGAGLALTAHRRVLRTPWPYVALLIAVSLTVPHVLWQIANDWPTAEFMRNATGEKMTAVSPADFVLDQIMAMGPANVVIWMSGLVFALVAPVGRRWRILALVYLAVALPLVAGGRSRASYLAVAYPMLLGLGGMALERLTEARPWRRLRAPLLASTLLFGLVPVPMVLPVFPVETFIRYQAALGLAPSTDENKEVGPLSQHYADMFGWAEMVAEVAKAYQGLTAGEREKAVVLGQNYGEAGAVDVLGRKHGLPRAVSGHNNYWLWGAGDWDGSVMIVIGGDPEEGSRFFEEWERVGTIDSPYAMPYERGLGVFVGRRFRFDPHQAWERMRHFD